jgi:hypothetical protein
VLVAAIIGLYIATIPFPWLREFGQLEPAKMDLTQSTFFSVLFQRQGSKAGAHIEALRAKIEAWRPLRLTGGIDDIESRRRSDGNHCIFFNSM